MMVCGRTQIVEAGAPKSVGEASHFNTKSEGVCPSLPLSSFCVCCPPV